MASVFLYVYPFAFDCRPSVGNNFPGRSPYTCISLYECLLFACIFFIDVLGGAPSSFPLSLLPPPWGVGRGRGRGEGIARGPSGCGTFLALDWFLEGISTVFMLCMSMSFLPLLNLCHVLMGMSTILLTDAMEP